MSANLNAFVMVGDTEVVRQDEALVAAFAPQCCDAPSSGFSYGDTVHLDVHAGDTYGFRVSGSNGDLNSRLLGDLTIAYNVVTNPSFEQGDMGHPTTFDRVSAGSPAIPGWTVATGDVDWSGGRWQAAEGVRSVEVAGSGPGEIYQDVPTIDGQRYEVRFFYSANPGRNGEPLAADCAGVPNPAPTYGFAVGSTVFTGPGNTFTLANSPADMKWQQSLVQFTATESVTRLRFFSTDPGTGCGIVFDNISATPVLDTVQDPEAITVTTADDHSDGLCGATDCTLREAIEWSNANSVPVDGGQNTIGFNIFGGTTIELGSPLPAITVPVSIDATTQSTASCPVPSGLLQVHVTPADAYNVGSGSTAGLTIAPSGFPAEIRGLVIDGFPGDGHQPPGRTTSPRRTSRSPATSSGPPAAPERRGRHPPRGRQRRAHRRRPGQRRRHPGARTTSISHNGGDGIAITEHAGKRGRRPARGQRHP